MAWYDEAVFYHIYPLGLLGCPHENDYSEPVHRLKELDPWIDHIADMGFNAIYIGPLFESVGHGYETTDYKKLDSRLGTNADLTAFVKKCHKKDIRVILDGVFNHTGRDFFAFKDIRENRENSRYLGWYSGVNLGGNNSFNDGFSYDNWGGFDLLVRLNQQNPEVQGYIADVIRFWVSEFDIDGLRLDAADVLDFSFMQMLRRVADEVKSDFYLMGEVIHGEYIRWQRDAQIHAVTNYHLHKALFSGHNDHNYFEIAHTVKRLYDMGGGDPLGLRLYNFADNHDVERIISRLHNRAHFKPLHILMYTLPGIPSVYYGSEFGIEGKKGGGDDWGLRPAIDLKEHKTGEDAYSGIIKALSHIRRAVPALSYGGYEQVMLTNRQYVFSRRRDDEVAVVAVNNDENGYAVNINVQGGIYRAMLAGCDVDATGGNLHFELGGADGEIFVRQGEKPTEKVEVNIKQIKSEPAESKKEEEKKAEETPVIEKKAQEEEAKTVHESPKKDIDKEEQHASGKAKPAVTDNTAGIPSNVPDKPYEEMDVPELQAAILQKMANNGPVTDDMKRTVQENVWKDSLINWVKSFR